MSIKRVRTHRQVILGKAYYFIYVGGRFSGLLTCRPPESYLRLLITTATFTDKQRFEALKFLSGGKADENL